MNLMSNDMRLESRVGLFKIKILICQLLTEQGGFMVLRTGDKRSAIEFHPVGGFQGLRQKL